jgi:uncharacterized integral membrane protein
MRKFLNAILFIPLGLLFVVFAVANRHPVTVSFDPFDRTQPELAVTVPLFVLILATAIFSVAIGGAATWIAQRHWRKAARQHREEAEQAQRELSELRAATSRQHVSSVPALPHSDAFQAFQDKPRLTL